MKKSYFFLLPFTSSRFDKQQPSQCKKVREANDSCVSPLKVSVLSPLCYFRLVGVTQCSRSALARFHVVFAEPGAGPKKERKERGPCRALCHKCVSLAIPSISDAQYASGVIPDDASFGPASWEVRSERQNLGVAVGRSAHPILSCRCGRRGHVSRDCRQMMALCTICHKYGHSKVECPRNGAPLLCGCAATDGPLPLPACTPAMTRPTPGSTHGSCSRCIKRIDTALTSPFSCAVQAAAWATWSK